MIDNKGDRLSSVKLHEELNFVITFECNKELITPEIVVGLHTSDFVHVLSVSNASTDTMPDFQVGTYQLTCGFNDIPLRPSSYNLRLAFLDKNRQMLWYAENIMAVPVVAGKFDITRMPEVGLIDLPSQWTLLIR